MGRKLYAKGEGFNPSTSIDDVEGLREELDALKGGSGGGGGDNAAIERRLTTAEGEIDALQGDVAEQSEEVAAVGAKVDTLQGTDSGKSVRTIAAEETAKIVGNAPANYDTLKEIADYIATDATGAAELSNKVNKNTTDIAKVAEDLSATHQLASNAESAISEVVELTIPAIEGELENKLGKTEKAADSAKADYATSAGSATNATNASQLGGVAAADYMQKNMSTSVITTAGWYRIAETVNPRQRGNTFRLHLKRGYYYKATEAYIFDVAIGWEGVTITQVSGSQFSSANTLIDKIRIDYPSTNAICYIDFHTITTKQETFYWEVIGDATPHITATLTGTLVGTPFELSTVNGLSSSHNITAPTFIGALQGNAESAAKLATARTIWGQSFDGTRGVIDDLILLSLAGNSDGNAPSARVVFAGGNPFYGPYIQAVTSGGYGLKKLIIYQNKTASWATDYSNHYEAVVIDIFGNVGIGITSPSEKLDVAGNIKASGNVSAKGLQIDGDVVITGNVTIQGRLESSASYQITPLATTSEDDEVPSVEQQLRSQISSLEERIATLEQLIAQNNG